MGTKSIGELIGDAIKTAQGKIWYNDPNSDQYKWAQYVGLASPEQIKKIAESLNNPKTPAAEGARYLKIVQDWGDQYKNSPGTVQGSSAMSSAVPWTSAGNDTLAAVFKNAAPQQYGLYYGNEGAEGPNAGAWRVNDPAKGGGLDASGVLAQLQPYMNMSGADLQKNWGKLPAEIRTKLGDSPIEFMKKYYFDPDGAGGWSNNYKEDTGFLGLDDWLSNIIKFGGMALGANTLSGAFGGAGAGAGSGAGAFDLGGGVVGSGLDVGGGIAAGDGLTTLTGAGAGTGGSSVDWFDKLIENYNPDVGFQMETLNQPGIDWTKIDSMIEKLGTSAGEAENLVTAKSIAEAGGMSLSNAQKLLSAAKRLGGSALSSLGGLKGLIPAALAAGLFEKNDNPLTGNVTAASNKALESAGAFGNMAPVGMQPSWQKAIELANSSAGAWKPYVDKAATYTSEAAGGIPSVNLSQYINPYIDTVLTPQLRNINQAADKERMRLAHLAKISGNDTYATPGSTSSTRYGVEEGTLNDGRFKAIGDATGLAYKGAFDTATGLATTDLNRKMTAGGAFNTMANTVGQQTGGDITRLAGAGDLEAKPQQNRLDHAADTTKLYTSVIPGTTSAITATNRPSALGQAIGAFGAYNAANKAGWFDEPPK